MQCRVIAYIDGFNLFFGMKEMKWKRYYWLNLHALIESLLKPGQSLLLVKYFTAMVSATPRDPDKSKRQSTYIDALSTLDNVEIIKGHYLSKTAKCVQCGNQWVRFEEKMTDVNIATQLLIDSYNDRFDTAILISADSDLCPPVSVIRQTFPEKRVVAVFPPGRKSKQLQNLVSADMILGRGKLEAAQFPESVLLRNGYMVKRPEKWK